MKKIIHENENNIKEEIMVINQSSSYYPELLKNIDKPPKELYCIGNMELLAKKMVAIVGSRKVSTYGRWVSETLARHFSQHDVAVVSGMAEGVDTYAHTSALKGKGGTIAVLGTGIDRCYPTDNRWLKNKIKEKGLVISEFPPGYPTRRYNFPMRNRIIAGMCPWLFVAEAGLDSGSLITANYSLDYGREVYAVPGNINSQYNLGSNKLLGEGAMPVYTISDAVRIVTHEEMKKDEIEDLGSDERKVYDFLDDGTEKTIDEISKGLNVPIGEVNALVTILEIKGYVYNSLGKVFVAK